MCKMGMSRRLGVVGLILLDIHIVLHLKIRSILSTV
ncbi:hypothetical protein MTR67_048135 [Solanum verrucosum]|uniref:Uncharacterized protein n=1 Tax=Solanum verrucosum TaxID=315347 RepID=A0AAF0UZ22_SOLVR|nr:hypothetical protein MTR67_048135 [Solanum verrucosum]